MTNDEVNFYIHEKIMGKCWHEPTESIGFEFSNSVECSYCRTDMGSVFGGVLQNPDYGSDESPRSLLNGVVARVLVERDWTYLDDALWKQINQVTNEQVQGVDFVKAPAEQIARACVEAHKNQPANATTTTETSQNDGETT